MDDFNNLLDIVMLVCFACAGAYGIYTSIIMSRWTELQPNKLIYPSGCRPENCVDPEGFRLYQIPRLMIFGVVALISAVIFGLGLCLKGAPGWLPLAGSSLGVVAVIYYCVVINKSYRRFW